MDVGFVISAVFHQIIKPMVKALSFKKDQYQPSRTGGAHGSPSLQILVHPLRAFFIPSTTGLTLVGQLGTKSEEGSGAMVSRAFLSSS